MVKLSTLKDGNEVLFKGRGWPARYAFLRYHIKRSMNERTPMAAEMAITAKCQLRCKHCSQGAFVREPHEQELSAEEIKSNIDQFYDLGGFRVGFFGGEPLLRQDLADFIDHATAKGMATRVTTNALLLTDERIRELKEAGLSMLNVSIDHPDPEVHDANRNRPGTFEQATDGVRRAVAAGMNVQLETFISRAMLNDNAIDRMVDLAKELGVFGVYSLFSMVTGNWVTNWDELLTLEERERARKYHNTTTKPYFRLEFPTEDTLCYVGKNKQVYISPYGNVSPCSTIHSWFGNTRKEPLADIWERMSSTIRVTNCGQCPTGDPIFRERFLDRPGDEGPNAAPPPQKEPVSAA